MCRVGLRVDVFNGSGKNYLGRGEMIGFVTVYVIENPLQRGQLSYTNAEEKPEGVPEEFIREVPSNPKIRLDTGQIVYGCQTWWRPIKES